MQGGAGTCGGWMIGMCNVNRNTNRGDSSPVAHARRDSLCNELHKVVVVM